MAATRPQLATEWYEDAPTRSAATKITLAGGEVRSGVDATLEPGGTIAGTVTGPAAAPLEGACVTVYDGDGEEAAEVDTDASGQFAASGLFAAPYRVHYADCDHRSNVAGEYYDDAATLAAADPIAVTAGSDRGGINATLGAPDPIAPETTITAGPAEGGRLGVAKATFGFSSTIAGSTFECRLDAGAWQPCASPRALTGLADGTHAFRVRATSPALLTDPTPASRSFTVAVAACKRAKAELTAAEDGLATAARKLARAKRLVRRAKRGDSPGKVSKAKRKLKKAKRAKRSAKRAVAAAEDSVARSCGTA